MSYLIKSKLNPYKEGYIEAIVLEAREDFKRFPMNLSIRISEENLFKIREKTKGRKVLYPKDLY